MSSTQQPSEGSTFSSPSSVVPFLLPTNGYGGSLYSVPFQVPTYNVASASDIATTTSWRMIDNFVQASVSVASVSGISFGLCLATLVYLLALTPSGIRKRPFHILLILALIAEVTRLLLDVVRFNQPGLSPYSAYLGLTFDSESTSWSVRYICLSVAKQSAAVLTYFFTIGSLYCQASTMLTAMRLQHAMLYWIAMSALLSVSVACLIFRILYAVQQAQGLHGQNSKLSPEIVGWGMAISYAISLGSWCSVSVVSVLHLLWSRLRLVSSNQSVYETVIGVLCLVCLESYVIPLIMVVIYAVPYDTPAGSVIFHSMDLAIPTVLVLLPLSTLFATARTNGFKRYAVSLPRQQSKDSPEWSTRNLIGFITCNTVMTRPVEIHKLPLRRQQAYPANVMSSRGLQDPYVDFVEEELRKIDQLPGGRPCDDCADAVSTASQDDVFKQRARRVAYDLAARGATPSGVPSTLV